MKRRVSHEEISESNARSKAIRVYSGSDSSEKLSYTEIFPKGYFKYSDADGFFGEADRLLISGRITEGKRIRDSSQLLQKSNVRSSKKQSERAVTETRVKEKGLTARNFNLLYLAGCALIFLMIYLCRRFLR